MRLTRRQFISTGIGTGVAVSTMAATGPISSAFADEKRNRLQQASDASPVAEGTYGSLLSAMAVISDTHVDNAGTAYSENLCNALSDIAQNWNAVDSIVVNGDLTDNGYDYQYDVFEQCASQAGLSFPSSFTCVMGNHEQMGDRSHTPDSFVELHETFLERTGLDSVYYDRQVGGSHVMVLGPDEYVSPSDVTSTDLFKLSTKQLSWLSGKLDEDEAAEVPSLVFIHEPLLDTVTDTYSGGWGYINSLVNDADLHSVIFAHKNAILFSGHTHSYPDVVQLEQDGNLFVGTGSVAYAYSQNETYETDNGIYDSYGWLVRQHTNAIEFCMRDFLRHQWVSGSHYIYSLARA